MTTRHKLALKIVVIVAGLGLAAKAAWSFPWKETYQALLRADMVLLAVATVVNLLSLVVKGTSWHLLLKPLCRNRWSSAQVGNLIGATVNNLSVSIAGEAARIQYVAQRDGLSWPAGAVSVAWARLIEGIGLAVFLVFAPALLHLRSHLGRIQLGAAAVLAIFCSVLFFRKRWVPRAYLPRFMRTALSSLAEIGSWKRVVWPILLSVSNWIFQWATFHLALVAINGRSTLAASFTALLVTNLGGLLRLTPANVGIFQAAMVTSLAAFGVTSERAMAASLALQGLQVVPVVVTGLLFMAPWRRITLAGRVPPLEKQSLGASSLSTLERAEKT
jgi:uncharacterized membrane protein YbhN (UPF0104 family)